MQDPVLLPSKKYHGQGANVTLLILPSSGRTRRKQETQENIFHDIVLGSAANVALYVPEGLAHGEHIKNNLLHVFTVETPNHTMLIPDNLFLAFS